MEDGDQESAAEPLAHKVFNLRNNEMDELREQLRKNGLPVRNTCLEVKVVPDNQYQLINVITTNQQTRKL
jgi:hypothetical protein